jgi:hypothetical protein
MDRWSWSWQGIITSIAATLLLLGISALLTWIKKKWPQHGDLVRYFLTTAAALGILLFVITGYVPFDKPRTPEITQDNLDEHVKKWAYDLGMADAAGATSPDYSFLENVSVKDGIIVTVGCAKQRPGFIQFQSTLTVSPEHQTAWSKLTLEEANVVLQEITLELARAHIAYTIVGGPTSNGTQTFGTIQNILVQRPVPLVSNFDEGMFAQALDEVDQGITVARAAVVLSLARHPHLDTGKVAR